ncbi:MAG: DNA translocase FtsK [Chloroflexi bacterium]|nr:DNA translocase FtsK [Chloroflexota bacterium]
MGKGRSGGSEGLSPSWSTVTLRLLWLVFVGVLLFVFWPRLLDTLGLGTFLAVLAVVGLTVVFWQRRLVILWERWNLWLGVLAFIVALLGTLAFFKPGDWPNSLGGAWGLAIIGNPQRDWQTALGVLRVVGVLILGVALFAPDFARREAGSWTERALPVLRQGLQRVGQSASRVLKQRSEHSFPRRILSWFGERRSALVSKARRSKQVKEEPKQKQKPAPSPRAPAKAVKVVPADHPPAAQEEWQLPSIDLLEETAKAELSRADAERRARAIEEALASYGVEARVVQINQGPAVTQFGVEPGWDKKYKEVKEKDRYGNTKVRTEEVSRTRVKVERITSLANDLALALAAPSIRIEAPVPGKALVGIEVPNVAAGLVAVREVLESAAFRKLSGRSKMALALGKGTSGEASVGDLAKMPHLLVAGATGSGKTVCLDAIIISILMNDTPDEVRFIMIDPKRVELIAFDGIPHLMNPVITESEKAVDVLKWLAHEMDNRYRRLAEVRAHNIEAYNRSPKVTKAMPCIVLIVDELADLMMLQSDEVEPVLCRLAQMGRAVGIHCVVATQRPSVDVITGLIKANFPTRISFAVASQVDSRTILDTIGAEKLLGRGDMLYLTPELAKPRRLQGCFVSPQELERVTAFWGKQARAQPVEVLTFSGEPDSGDPLLNQARKLAKEGKPISVSYLQRQLRIGSARAEELVKMLQQEGGGDGTGPGKPDQPVAHP